MNKMPVRLRFATPEDVDFIFNSWLKSYRNSPHATCISNPIYFSEQHRLIEALLKRSNVVVATPEDDPLSILGWICAGRVDGIFALHYVYVKHVFRGLGIADMLIAAVGHKQDEAGIYTHLTSPMAHMREKYNLLFHPFVLSMLYDKKSFTADKSTLRNQELENLNPREEHNE